MKKLIKQYLIQIYEVSSEVTMDKNEEKEKLAKVVKKSISEKELDVVRAAAKRRQQEIEDYFTGNLPHNAKADDDQKTSQEAE